MASPYPLSVNATLPFAPLFDSLYLLPSHMLTLPHLILRCTDRVFAVDSSLP